MKLMLLLPWGGFIWNGGELGKAGSVSFGTVLGSRDEAMFLSN